MLLPPRRAGRRARRAVRRAAGQQGGDEGLDAPLPRGEVVGDDQRPASRLGPARAQSSASATRWARVGWEPKNHCQATGGSGSDRLVRGQAALHVDEGVPGSAVRSRACTSARASMCRETRFCTGVETRVPTAMRKRTQRDRPAGRPAESAPAATQQPRGQQPAQGRDPRGGTEGAEQGAGEDVVGRDVAQLVGGDRLDLGVGQPVEHRVVDDDPPGRPESGDVGVQRRRPPGGVGDQHVLHRGAVLLGELEQVGAQLPGRHRTRTG